MKKFTPWLFLIPLLALLAGLPAQLQGHLPYHISMVSYVLSIFGWLFTFCGVLAISRASGLSRLFFVLVALVVIMDAGYRLWIGPRDWLNFTFHLIVLWLVIALARSFPSTKHDDTT